MLDPQTKLVQIHWTHKQTYRHVRSAAKIGLATAGTRVRMLD